jgi:hypothetical protein
MREKGIEWFDLNTESYFYWKVLTAKRYAIYEQKTKIKEMEEYVITNAPPNEGPTHRLSDHKPIWMQLKLF